MMKTSKKSTQTKRFTLGVMKRILTLMLALVIGAMCLPPMEASAATSDPVITFKVRGTKDYDYAYKVLNLMNKEREKAGVGKLKMDKNLLNAAMQRAAEVAVSFSHTRPNGKDCFSASTKMYGENIAIGYVDPEDVMNGWMNSQGHRENMLNSSYNTVGIGVFESNGTYCWVQCFGYSYTSVKKPANKVTNVKIYAKLSKVKWKITPYAGVERSSKKLKVGKTTKLKVVGSNNEFSSSYQVVTTSLNWVTSDSNIATVKNGVVTAKKAGTTYIRVKGINKRLYKGSKFKIVVTR